MMEEENIFSIGTREQDKHLPYKGKSYNPWHFYFCLNFEETQS